MSPPPSPRARPATVDKRDAILAAALDLFVERGFHGTTVPEVADQAGVGAGTIYRYFASKEALVNAIFGQYKTEVTASVMRDFSVDAPARQLVHHLWTRLAAFAIAKPRAYAFLELHHHTEYLDDTSREIERRILDLAVRFISAAQARGEIKPLPPMLLVAIITGAFVGMVRKAWEGLLELTPDVVAGGEQCAWEAIRA